MKKHPRAQAIGDFTADWRMVPITALAIVIGLLSTGVAWALLRLIGLFINLCYYHRWDTTLVSPAGNQLGAWAILIPVAGSLVIGLMARYGSERIRGHGIPEAIESILINGSRVQPRLAILKPLSSAISIGTGGPFGAEGPIIMTGGGRWLARRAIPPPQQRGAQNAARRGCRGWHVGDVQRTDCGGLARGGVVVVRMAPTQRDSGGTGLRHRRGRAAISAWRWCAVSYATPFTGTSAHLDAGVRAGRHRRRWPGDRSWWTRLSAGARRRLRHARRAAWSSP